MGNNELVILGAGVILMLMIVTIIIVRLGNLISELGKKIESNEFEINYLRGRLKCIEADIDVLNSQYIAKDAEYDYCESDVCEEESEIHLISREQYYLENNGYAKYALLYDEESDILQYSGVNIGNVDECIGDGLKFFGVRSGDKNSVYVRNHKFRSDFKIVKKDFEDYGTL